MKIQTKVRAGRVCGGGPIIIRPTDTLEQAP